MPDLKDPTTKTVNGVDLTRMDDVEIPDEVYEPMKTGIPVFDDFLSTKGGVPKATINVWAGEPGVGKTTVACKALAKINGAENRTLFISSEMDHVDFNEYSKRFPEFGKFYTFFPNLENNILDSLEDLIEHGFDMILLDSFLDIKDKIAEQEGITKKKAELFLVDLLKKAKGGVETGSETYYTTWIVIQQMTKGGDMAGSKYLQHVITSDLRLVNENEQEEVRYMTFKKNRRGQAFEKLYYEIDDDEINFDIERREREKEALDFLEEEKDRKENEEFASIEDLENDLNMNVESEGSVESDESEGKEEEERVEEIRKLFVENDGNRRATMRDAVRGGLWNEEDSYHYFRILLTENGMDDYRQ